MASDNHTPIQHLVDDHNNKKQSSQSSISYGKETGPVEVSPERQKYSESIYEETEPKVEDRDVEKFMKVEKKPQIELDPMLKQAGLSAIDTSTLDPKHRIQLPISDEKVMEGLQQPLTTSLRWLSEFAMYMLHRGHLTLKKIHGHVVRVMMR